MRVLVTGGAGYIGSHAVRALARHGHEPIVYDNLSTGYAFLAKGFELIVADVGDASALGAALAGCDAVMHFAAHSQVGESVRDPRKYFENNVRSGLTLLNSVIEAGIRRFLFSSTCAVCGIPERVPITEDMPTRPVNPYGASKLFFEHALAAYCAAYGVEHMCLRYFNAAGADDSGEIGELHQPETHLIPCALGAALGLRQELQVFGDDYPTPDGTCVRDYIHVSDLAEAHVLALEYLSRGGDSSILNLGTGNGYSVTDVITAAERVTGTKIPRRIVARRPGDPPVLVADPTRAQTLLGWKAERSLEEMVGSAWRWMESRQLAQRAA